MISKALWSTIKYNFQLFLRNNTSRKCCPLFYQNILKSFFPWLTEYIGRRYAHMQKVENRPASSSKCTKLQIRERFFFFHCAHDRSERITDPNLMQIFTEKRSRPKRIELETLRKLIIPAKLTLTYYYFKLIIWLFLFKVIIWSPCITCSTVVN